MEILNEDTFSMEALNQGTEEVKKEGGFFSSLEEAITNGLINALKTIISNSGMFCNLVNNLSEDEATNPIDEVKPVDEANPIDGVKPIDKVKPMDEVTPVDRVKPIQHEVKPEKMESSDKKGLIGKVLAKIANFFTGNKIKKTNPENHKKENTLLSNQNIEITTLKKENEMLKAQVFRDSRNMEKILDLVTKYTESSYNEKAKEKPNISKALITEEENQLKK